MGLFRLLLVLLLIALGGVMSRRVAAPATSAGERPAHRVAHSPGGG